MDRRRLSSKIRARFVVLALGCVVLGGCPAEECEDPPVSVAIASDGNPNVGRFSGPFSWLQTGEETTLDTEIVPLEQVAAVRCGVGTTPIHFSTVSSDGVIDETFEPRASIRSDGALPSAYGLTLRTAVLVAAGKIPEAPDILSRQPETTLSMRRQADDTWEVLVRVRTASDDFVVGLGTLTRRPAP
jgi:hypothetical protein